MAPAHSTLVHDPPASTRPSNPDSPITKKASHVVQSCPNPRDIHQRRQNTLLELGQSVPQLPVNFFTGKDGVLPPLPSDDPEYLNNVLNDLKSKGALPLTKAGTRRWEWFKRDPSRDHHKENDVFAKLDKIVEAVKASAGMDREPTLSIQCNPDMAPIDVTRDNKTRPDCYGVFSNTENANIPSTDEDGKPYWISIGVPGEFKKETSDAVQNWTQILWSMNYVFQEDPRRRFVFAFTIEDTSMRIWFASRSDVLVSFPFDFNQRHDYMVEFFLRVMYAKEDQLGWDTTMERLPAQDPSEPFQYKIDCDGVAYKTVRILSDIGAEAIRGRGTRVWEVREITADGEGEKPLVLKDVWVDETRKREATILEEIRTTAQAKGFLEGFERHFMHVRRSGDVHIGEARELDHTHKLHLQGPSLDLLASKNENSLTVKVEPRKKSKAARKAIRKKGKAAKAATRDAPVGSQKAPADPVEKSPQYAPKVHHRIVFEELGCTIAEVDSLSRAINALSDAMRALKILHQCGWVHRDISTGNILVVDGVGKLSDLEYAKRAKDVQRHGVRTGTPYFMATEVEDQEFTHMPDTYLTEEGNEGDPSDMYKDYDLPEDQESEGAVDSAPPSSYAPSESAVDDEPESESDDSDLPLPCDPDEFRHNPLHDLESAWWVNVWLLVCSKFVKGDTKVMPDNKWAECLKNHETAAFQMFKNPTTRAMAINPGISFTKIAVTLLPPSRWMANELKPIRAMLLNHYHSAYVDRHTLRVYPSFATIAGDLHDRMIRLLDNQVTRMRKDPKLDLKIDVCSEFEQEDKEEVKREGGNKGKPSQVDPERLPALQLTKRSSEAAEAEPVQRKRRKVSHGAAASAPVAETSRMTRSYASKLRR